MIRASAATVMLAAAALIVAWLASGGVSSPAVDGLAVVQNRLAAMKRHGSDVKTIRDYLDDKADLAKAQAAGADLASSLRELPAMFPEATGMAQFPGKSGAKPTIWADWNTFLADIQSAVAKADALNTALKAGDKTAIRNAVADLGKNGCAGCHETFREKI